MRMTITIETSERYGHLDRTQLEIRIEDYDGQMYREQISLPNEMLKSDFERLWRMTGDKIMWNAKTKMLETRAGK
ncbi:hypothetical protein ES705_25923 [subsurface metagenome]